MSAVFADVDAIIGKLFEMNNSNMALQSDLAFIFTKHGACQKADVACDEMFPRCNISELKCRR